MFHIEELYAGYGEKEVLKGIELKFSRGKVYAILGPNGSGKSTLLRAMVKIIKYKKGRILLDNQDIKNLSAKEIARKIAYLPQRSNSVPHSTVFDSILLGRKPHIFFEPSKRDIEIVEKLIHEFSLMHHAFRKIDELSGGEAQKVLIARALAQEPEVLLLDEPVNHLDPKNQLEILWLLKKTTNDFKIATVVVLHDINLAIQFADYFIFMKNGEIYREGDLNIIGSALIRDVYDIDVEIIEVDGTKFVIMKS